MLLPSTEEQRLRELVKVFLEENSKVNLSAFRTEELCWTGNVLDSLSVLEAPASFPTLDGKRILDLGTGGGYPLLPLALCVPDATFTGVDSVQKKIDAIGRIVTTMQLKNVELISSRAEVLGHEAQYREEFDVVTARAVAPINTLLEYCSAFVKPKGHIILWKSLNIEKELEESLLARAEFSCHLTAAHTYSLGEGWGERQLLLFEKTAFLSRKYPREVGVPKKDPVT